MKNNVMWLPLSATLVPFHISVIKNVAVQHEGKTSVFRINFNVPGKFNKYANEFPKHRNNPIYISELIFRSAAREHYERLQTDFKQMLKEYNPLLHLKETTLSSLITNTGKRPALDDLYVKPTISGKKSSGRLELHKNGFRFKTKKSEELDILFENIRFCFFQRALDHEAVILHLHLRQPLIIGGKRTADVQFYAQIGTLSDELMSGNKKRVFKGGRRSYNDDDEDNDEVYNQAKMSLEKAFEGFVAAVEKETNGKIVFEEVHSDDGFNGAFNFSSETIYPTDSCMVSLITQPYLIVPYEDVEIVAFERTGMMNRTFDIALVFKDYSKPVISINGVSSGLKSAIKAWLDSKDLVVMEGVSNLKWPVILKRICNNLDEFVNGNGGWAYFVSNPEFKNERGSGSPGSAQDDESSFSSQEADGSDYLDFDSSDESGSNEAGDIQNSDAEGDSDEKKSIEKNKKGAKKGQGKDAGGKNRMKDEEDEEEEFLFSDDESSFSEAKKDDDYEADSEDSFIVKSKEKKRDNKGRVDRR